jgi:flagellar hook protein FlgE
MGYQQGLSGLSAASSDLDVIGNNISNANTVGFKGSTAEFSDMYASALVQAAGNSAGIGTRVSDVAQSFTQGSISETSKSLDVAINGNGFFTLQTTSGQTVYSRDGEFTLDANGNITNSAGDKVMGFQANASGIVSSATLSPLVVPSSALAPVASTKVSAEMNLNSGDAANTAAFSATDSSTYNSATSTTVYDSLGTSHTVSMYFKKTDANTWDAYASVDGSNATTPVKLSPSLSFDSSGALTSTGTASLSFTPTTGAAAQTISLDFSKATQYGSATAYTSMTPDGNAAGTMSSFSIDDTGTLKGSYSNGQTTSLGQIALSSFVNVNGLQNLGNNVYSQSQASGSPTVGAAGTGNLGALQSGAVEESNVDLTSSLVNLITAQRYYQANAQTIKTQQAVDQTLTNL